DAVQDAAARAAPDLLPGGERVARRFAGQGDLVAGRAGHLPERGVVDRREVPEGFARAGNGIAVDEVPERFAAEAREVCVGLRELHVQRGAHGLSLPAWRAFT